jgi:hypothetical protein
MVIRMNAMFPLPDSADATLQGSSPTDAEARSMVERLTAADHRSTAEMLEDLRRSFPDSPLAFRVRALAALLKR